MATHSRIAVELPEGNVISVYCHHDGYPDGVGQDLLKEFPNGTNPGTVEDFIYEGDRSSIEEPYGQNDSHVECSSVDAFFAGDIEEYGYLYTQEGKWIFKSAYSFPNFTTELEEVFNH